LQLFGFCPYNFGGVLQFRFRRFNLLFLLELMGKSRQQPLAEKHHTVTISTGFCLIAKGPRWYPLVPAVH